MTAIDFARIRRLVEEAHALGPEERERFLAAACGGDSELLGEVRALIATAESSPGFLDPPAAAPALGPGASGLGQPTSDLSIGGYRLVRRIASGGMGTVWEAEQAEPRRKVALKMLRAGFPSREAVRRFRHEAQILARLAHPNIARVYASGIHPLPGGEGLPWYAMEYVEGARTLLDHARETGASQRDRLELFATLCSAVQHGHERGVIHRDLKPGNVLVDAQGRVQVIDFGIARLIEPSGEPGTLATRTGQVLGTLQYMSPEQVAGSSDGVDTRSDVYALGVVLYELLTFEPPFALAELPLAQAARVLQERPAPRPSSHAREVDADLDAIVLKALEKDPARRYASAAALGADVERYLGGDPIEARQPSVGYYLRIFARRHKALFAGALLAFVSLATATAISLGFAWRAQRAEAQALDQRDATRFNAYAANVSAAYGALRSLDVVSARARLEACPPDLRGFEWRLLDRRLDRSRWTRAFEGNAAQALIWLPDGRRLVLASTQGDIELRAAPDGRILEQRTALSPGRCFLAVDPGGRRIVALSSTGWLQVFSADPFTEVAVWLAHEDPAIAVDFGCDERVFATLSSKGTIRLWDVETGDLLREHRTVVAGLGPCLDLDVGTVVHRLGGHGGYLSAIEFSPDGTELATASHDHMLRLWDPRSGELRAVLQGHSNLVQDVAFSPDGRLLASGGWDRTVRLWNVKQRTLAATLLGHVGSVDHVAFSPDGRALASADDSCHLKGWNIDPPDPDVREVRGKWIWAMSFLPGGRELVAVHGGFAHRFDASDGSSMATYPYQGGAGWRSLAVAPDGTRLALGDGRGFLELWSAAGERELRLQAHPTTVWSLSWRAAGDRIATAAMDGGVRLFEVDGTLARDLGRLATTNAVVAFDPSGARLAVSGGGGRLVVLDGHSGDVLGELAGLGADVTRLAWSPDALRIALALSDGRVLLCSPRGPSIERALLGHEAQVTGVAFAPDGSRLATCGNDRSLRLWELEAGREVASFGDHAYFVDAVAFSPDGTLLATGSVDSTLRLWRADLDVSIELDPAERLREQVLEAWLTARARDAPRLALERARIRAAETLSHQPGDAFAARTFAALRLRMGELAAAQADLAAYLAAHPDDPQARALFGLALVQGGRESEARLELERLDALDPAADPASAAGLRLLRRELRDVLARR